MIEPKNFYKKVGDKWISRFIMDEVVIMPLCRSEEDVQYIYSISNETGSKIWQLLDGSYSVGDIQEILKSEYQGKGEVIEREVLTFISDLSEEGLIEKGKTTHQVSGIQRPESGIQRPDIRRSYRTPEISRVKMQPEQAVLSCCSISANYQKTSYDEYNRCSEDLACIVLETCLTAGRSTEGMTVSAGMS